MSYNEERAPRAALIIFPIAVTILAGVIVPMSAPLIGSLMFGNLLRECGVLERLSKTAQNELANLVTILLGLTIGSTMVAANFIRWDTLLILGLGLFAFVFDTAGGVLFAKFINLFRKNKINPMIGAAGISAFPMIQGRSNFVYRIKNTNTFVSLGLKDKYDVTPIHGIASPYPGRCPRQP